MKEQVKNIIIEIVSWIIVALIISFIVFWLCGCTTQYVPVETVRTEYKTKTDTVKVSDTIRTEKETILREARPEDSAMIAKLGIKLRENERLLILLRNQLTEANSKQYESHTDTIIKTDSIQVPYPVPAQLSRWERFCCDYGKIMVGALVGLIIGFVILLIKQKK